MRYREHEEGLEHETYGPHDGHDMQFSYQAQYMGDFHANMNDGSKAVLGDQRRASHKLTVMPKVIDSTRLTERRDELARSADTRYMRGFDHA